MSPHNACTREKGGCDFNKEGRSYVFDFAFGMHQISDPDLRNDLMNAYIRLDCYPEVPKALSLLKARGLKLAILSNGTHEMLDAAVKN